MTSSGHTENLTIATKATLKEAVPGDRITMDIPLGELKRLPPNASYNSKSGRAGITLHVAGDTLTATASCDSLERLVEYYEDMYMSAMDRLDNMAAETSKQNTGTPLLERIKTFFAGLVAGILFMTLKKIAKWIKNSIACLTARI